MARKKVKLAWIENDSTRATSFKKRRLGLLKKIKELTILCDVKACMILFSLNEAMPMVWPSHEKVRDLLDGFFALPEMEKKKKETNLESYLKEKTKKVHEKLMKKHKKNMKNVINQLMVQLHRGRRIADLSVNEIYALISFSKDNIIHYRKRLDSVQHPPLRDPPVFPFEDFRTTTTNNAFVGGVKEDERAWKTDVRENQSYYLLDQWVFASPKPPKPRTNQQTGIDMVSCSKNPNPNPNLEMEPVGPPVMTFHGSFGSVSQPLQHHSMISNPTMAMSQPRQYPIDFMSRELEVKEEGSNVNNDDSEFHRRSNAIVINDGIRQEPPPNGNDDATSFDMNKVWPEINNN